MIILLDGAMGTQLQIAGIKKNECPEFWNITHSDIITSIHKKYLQAGSSIIETNSFGANMIKLSEYGLSDKHDAINRAAVSNARNSLGNKSQSIAASVGPTGKLLRPLGAAEFDEVCECYYKQIKLLSEEGVDYILIETMTDIQEARAAVIAAKTASNLPIICHMSFERNGRTASGTDAATAAVILDKLGVSILGANCSTGPVEMYDIVCAMKSATTKPISVMPNAGLPSIVNGQTFYQMNAENFAKHSLKLIQAGAIYIGGCCGTSPEHIAALKLHVGKSCAPVTENSHGEPSFTLCSRTKLVAVSKNQTTPTVIGERINPTNRKALAAELRSGSINMLLSDAKAQQLQGAEVLDVNLGISGINQACMMKKVVEELSSITTTPLSIDTTDADVLEAGLKAFPGRALINSVSHEKKRMSDFLNLAKKYGAAVLVLPVTDEGIPSTAQERLTVASSIIAYGLSIGLSSDDFLLDPLVLPVATDEQAAKTTIETIRLYKNHFDTAITIGLSNISFGLPSRSVVNTAFLLSAIGAGVNVPILNPLDEEIERALLIAGMFGGKKSYTSRYTLSMAKTKQCETADAPKCSNQSSLLLSISQAIYDGNKEQTVSLVEQAMTVNSVAEIAESGIAAGIIRCGEDYNAGILYLPQILISTEAAKAAFDSIKQVSAVKPIGRVVIGTVNGDIHDLGKNIVAALLSNSGFEIIDLGKNVSRETFLDAWNEKHPDIIGLSALMTTTMVEIEPTIQFLKNNGCTSKFIVGGAVVTSEYAAECGADAYAYDAIEAISICKSLVSKN